MLDLIGIKKQTDKYNAQALQLQKDYYELKTWRLAFEFISVSRSANALEHTFITGMKLVNHIKDAARRFGKNAKVHTLPNTNVMEVLLKKGRGK